MLSAYPLSLTRHPSQATEHIRLGAVLMVLTDSKAVPTASYSPVSPFLRFVVAEPNRMNVQTGVA